jgi:hypothetical protein
MHDFQPYLVNPGTTRTYRHCSMREAELRPSIDWHPFRGIVFRDSVIISFVHSFKLRVHESISSILAVRSLPQDAAFSCGISEPLPPMGGMLSVHG